MKLPIQVGWLMNDDIQWPGGQVCVVIYQPSKLRTFHSQFKSIHIFTKGFFLENRTITLKIHTEAPSSQHYTCLFPSAFVPGKYNVDLHLIVRYNGIPRARASVFVSRFIVVCCTIVCSVSNILSDD